MSGSYWVETPDPSIGSGTYYSTLCNLSVCVPIFIRSDATLAKVKYDRLTLLNIKLRINCSSFAREVTYLDY